MTLYVCHYWHEWDWDDWDNKPIPEGFREETLISADTRGKAKSQYVQFLQTMGYDVQWTDKFSIRKD